METETNITDKYSYLEEDDNKIKEWQIKQLENFNLNFNKKNFEKYKNILSEIFGETSSTVPIPCKAGYYYQEKKSGEQQYSLYLKNQANDSTTCLVNTNTIDKTGCTQISSWSYSPSDKYITYELSSSGKEMGALQILDIENETLLSDRLDGCRYTDIEWESDLSGFYYIKHPENTSLNNTLYLNQKVYFHKLSTPQSEDVLIFGEGRDGNEMLKLSSSYDSRYLIIKVSKNWKYNDVIIYDTETKTTLTLIENINSKFNIHFSKEKVFIHTNYQAENYRVLSCSVEKWLNTKIVDWEECIPVSDNKLQEIVVSDLYIFLHLQINACSLVRIHSHSGVFMSELELPQNSSIHHFGSRVGFTEVYYGVKSYTIPFDTYCLDTLRLTTKKIREKHTQLDSKEYSVRQELVKSEDNVYIPIFIVHKNSIDISNKNPCILYGYGAHGSVSSPAFLADLVPFIKEGGIYVAACVRGGGELGTKWHVGGTGLNKINGINDFIKTAEYLIEKNYTSNNKLGLYGGSMGGTLVTAAAILRPDIFKAVCAMSPIADIVRFHKFGMAARWTDELGDPDTKEGLEAIMKWSPYHNIRENTKYPDFLFICGQNDTRVHLMHSRKMVTKLQDSNSSNRAFYFSIINTGHGPGMSTDQAIEMHSIKLCFFMNELFN